MNDPAPAVALPVRPPVRPMLARLVRELPVGDYLYEPKWDGFRCLVFRDGDRVDLRSRNDRPLARYFPEVVEACRRLARGRCVLDGELLVLGDGRADFETLMARLHPAASRAAVLAVETPASFVGFDVLAVDDDHLTEQPFAWRRATLEDVTGDASPTVSVTPITDDPDVAAGWLDAATGGGIDGVVAKQRDSTYQPGKRTMIKVKHERTVDCVVAGVRLFGEPVSVASLLLAVYDEHDVLQHVGVASSFTQQRREELVREVAPFAIPLQDHPWREGFGAGSGRVARLPGAATTWTPDLPLDWVPLRPELVCEVAYDHVESGRFRHPAKFRRWRPDRDAASCRTDQLSAAGADLTTLWRP